MRGIPTDVLALLDARRVTFHAAHKIYSDPVQRVWSGHHTLEIDGEDYLPLGATNLATDLNYQVGQVANGFTISVSSLDPTLAERVLTTDYRGCDMEYRTLFFDEHGMSLLHAELDLFGTVDEVQVVRVPGGLGTVTFKLEGEAQGVRRQGGRLGADADQRLILSTDGSRKYQSVAPQIKLIWYGKPPVRSVAIAQ